MSNILALVPVRWAFIRYHSIDFFLWSWVFFRVYDFFLPIFKIWSFSNRFFKISEIFEIIQKKPLRGENFQIFFLQSLLSLTLMCSWEGVTAWRMAGGEGECRMGNLFIYLCIYKYKRWMGGDVHTAESLALRSFLLPVSHLGCFWHRALHSAKFQPSGWNINRSENSLKGSHTELNHGTYRYLLMILRM